MAYYLFIVPCKYCGTEVERMTPRKNAVCFSCTQERLKRNNKKRKEEKPKEAPESVSEWFKKHGL